MPQTEPPTPPPRLILAPLLGVTTAVFRRVFQSHFGGFDQAMSPFIAVTHGKLPPLKYFKDVRPEYNCNSIPLIPQLIGKDGLDFREMANHLHDQLGYAEVNWNIGCPSPTVTSRVRGAGMLAHPTLIDRFLDTACSGLRCRLSIKMRLGMEHPDEYLELVNILNRYPIAEITIHPRTGRQLYTGKADVERFADLKARLLAPIVYNGDIRTWNQAYELAQRFGDLSGLMIGRGVISNPTLALSIQSKNSENVPLDYLALRSFHHELYDTYCQTMEGGAGPILGKMKEIWTYWVVNFGEIPVRRVLKSKSLVEFEGAVERAFIDQSAAHDTIPKQEYP